MNSEAPTPECTILVVDDDAKMAFALKRFLQQEEYNVEVALSGPEALEVVGRKPCICLALVDLSMPLMDGLTLMGQLHQRNPDLPVIIMTAFATVETAVEALKRGAEDYVMKPFEPEAVATKIERLLSMYRLRARLAPAEGAAPSSPAAFGPLLYASPVMQAIVERARFAAETNVALLLVGDTGTGKEVLARAIHQASSRRSAPFIAVNCGALPRELVETELFGARRGAYTGAYTDTPGVFASAHGGTVFLDEIGEMPKEAQVKLLRVLQEREIRPVGSAKSFPVDVRVIAATNRPVSTLRGEYMRDDLYYRIATVVLEIPPLRARPEDVVLLAQHFLQRLCQRYGRVIQLSRRAWDLLLGYHFPGNVRELQNLLEGLAVFSADNPQIISTEELRRLLRGAPEATSEAVDQPVAIESLERMAIQRALRLCEGNRTKAANLLGISRYTLYRKLREYNDTDSLPQAEPLKPPLGFSRELMGGDNQIRNT